MEKIKSWAIVGLFAICFFGFMISSYRYRNLNEKYEDAVKKHDNYEHLIDSLLEVNEGNDEIIKDLNCEVDALNICILDLNKEKIELTNKLKEANSVYSNNISVAAQILRENLKNE